MQQENSTIYKLTPRSIPLWRLREPQNPNIPAKAVIMPAVSNRIVPMVTALSAAMAAISQYVARLYAAKPIIDKPESYNNRGKQVIIQLSLADGVIQNTFYFIVSYKLVSVFPLRQKKDSTQIEIYYWSTIAHKRDICNDKFVNSMVQTIL